MSPAAALDTETCYQALRARDPRFDGAFFVAVSTTGVYCRPICPARTPGKDRCAFFARPAEAERAGYRACFRCRPELAPGGAPVDAVGRLVRAAMARIDQGFLAEGSVAALAGELGVTPRHLRRAMEAELGVTPVELAQTRRLALAKQLLQDTRLSMVDVAFTAGFASLRRFNASFKERFGRPPSAVRREATRGAGDVLHLRLDYRPPLDWRALLAFLGARAVPGVEVVEGASYHRSVRVGARTGTIGVEADPTRASLRARVSVELAPALPALVPRLRALLDLDARPDAIAAHLGRDPLLSASVRARPGLRVAGSVDGFEIGARAVLGQRISVAAARTLLGRLALAAGEPLAASSSVAGLTRLFPTARAVTRLGEADLRQIGIGPPAARPLLALARAVDAGALALDAGGDPARVRATLEGLPGIGPWTSAYIAMRALGSPDVFPAGDLVLRRVMGAATEREAAARAAAWTPWRSYAAFHLWQQA